MAFDGQDIGRLATHGRVEAGIALSPEGRHVFPQMRVEENLELGVIPRTQSQRPDLLEEMLSPFPRLRERIQKP